MKLTSRQNRFVEEYCVSHCAADAARKAGYSEKTARSIGHENLTKPDILTAIETREQAAAHKLGVTKERMLGELLDAIQMARGQMNPRAMIVAASAVAKLMGFYSPEVHQVGVAMSEDKLMSYYQGLSDAQLQEIISGAAG